MKSMSQNTLHWGLALSLSLLVSAAPALTVDADAKKAPAQQTQKKKSNKASKKSDAQKPQSEDAAPEVKSLEGEQATTPAKNTADDKKENSQADPTASSPELEKLSPQTRAQLQALYDAMHLEAKGINNEVRDDEELTTKDIALLWQAAVERSGTIRYAIEKLSNRDATGQPVSNDGFTRKMVQNIARLGGVAGSMWTGTPTGMLGGSMVDNMLSGDPTDPALQRITDADMVLLAKEVESLQSRVIDLYYQYHQAEERLALVREANRTLGKYYDQAQQKDALDPALESLMATLYETSRQEEDKAKQAFASARDALTLVVGLDAMTAFEKFRQDEAS